MGNIASGGIIRQRRTGLTGTAKTRRIVEKFVTHLSPKAVQKNASDESDYFRDYRDKKRARLYTSNIKESLIKP
jgi:hypothetical protein